MSFGDDGNSALDRESSERFELLLARIDVVMCKAAHVPDGDREAAAGVQTRKRLVRTSVLLRRFRFLQRKEM